jgi:hypothetical protein
MEKREYGSPELHIAPMEALALLIEESVKNGKSVNFMPRGVSMLPMLVQGRDSVVLSPVTGKLKKYDLPLYRRENGAYVLHRIIKVDGETYTCIGDNQYKAEQGVTHESVIAVVSEFTRKGKTKTVKSFSYRAYCRFWHYSRFIRHVISALKRRIFRKKHK